MDQTEAAALARTDMTGSFGPVRRFRTRHPEQVDAGLMYQTNFASPRPWPDRTESGAFNRAGSGSDSVANRAAPREDRPPKSWPRSSATLMTAPRLNLAAPGQTQTILISAFETPCSLP
jgi:hypothetical protein